MDGVSERPNCTGTLPGMAHLRLSTDELIDVGTKLRTVAAEFHGADATSTAIADAVGHAGLA